MCNCNSQVKNVVDTMEKKHSLQYQICSSCEHHKLISIFGIKIVIKCDVDNSNVKTIIITEQHCPINKF